MRRERPHFKYDYENFVHHRCGGAVVWPRHFGEGNDPICECCGAIAFGEVAVRIVRVA